MIWFGKKNINRKVNKRPTLYSSRFSFFEWLKYGFGFVGVAAVMGGGIYFFTKASYFRLAEVHISGRANHVTAQQVLALANLKPEQNLLWIRLNRVAENLKRHPWIKNVKVRYQLPRGIWIDLTEYEPMAMIQTSANRYFIDRDGILFKKFSSEDQPHLPMLSGFDEQAWRAHPSYYRRHMTRLIDFMNAFEHHLKSFGIEITKILYNQTDGLLAELKEGESEGVFHVFFGWDFFGEKMQKLKKVIEDVHASNATLRMVDLHVPEKVFAKFGT